MNNPEQKSRSEIQKTEHGAWKSRLDDTKNMHSQTHSSFSFPLMSSRDHFNQSFRSGCKSNLRQGTLLDVPCNLRAYKLCTDFHNLHRSLKFKFSCWNGSYGYLRGIYLEVFDRFIAFIRLIRKKIKNPGLVLSLVQCPRFHPQTVAGVWKVPKPEPLTLSPFSFPPPFHQRTLPFPAQEWSIFSVKSALRRFFFCVSEVLLKSIVICLEWRSPEEAQRDGRAGGQRLQGQAGRAGRKIRR